MFQIHKVIFSSIAFLLPSISCACTEVEPEFLKIIARGFAISGLENLDHTTARAVRSNDFRKVYFIAAEIRDEGSKVKRGIGLWASNSLEPGKGMIFSVNYMAEKFSTWPSGNRYKSKLSQYDHGGQEALNCLRRVK